VVAQDRAAASVEIGRPSVLGLVVSSVEGLAFGNESCEARDGDRLESQGIPAVLDMEKVEPGITGRQLVPNQIPMPIETC
jgi:hypothetical protein